MWFSVNSLSAADSAQYFLFDKETNSRLSVNKRGNRFSLCYYTGYVLLFNCNITEEIVEELEVLGGVTYYKNIGKHSVLGFDTGHYGLLDKRFTYNDILEEAKTLALLVRLVEKYSKAFGKILDIEEVPNMISQLSPLLEDRRNFNKISEWVLERKEK